MTTTPTESASPVEAPAIDNLRTAEIDAIVDTAAEAARAFRKLDQQQVDAIVEAMVRAGVRAAGELAGVAIEETGFGVFEDKVVKNYVATEFLHDYRAARNRWASSTRTSSTTSSMWPNRSGWCSALPR